jgi:hypothetical protein
MDGYIRSVSLVDAGEGDVVCSRYGQVGLREKKAPRCELRERFLFVAGWQPRRERIQVRDTSVNEVVPDFMCNGDSSAKPIEAARQMDPVGSDVHSQDPGMARPALGDSLESIDGVGRATLWRLSFEDETTQLGQAARADPLGIPTARSIRGK